MENTSQPTFGQDTMEAIVLKIFKDNNFTVAEELKGQYVPELSAQLQQRIGLTLIALIPEDKISTYAALLDKEETSVDDWNAFWRDAVPTYEQEMKNVVEDFSKSVAEVMAI